MKAKKDNKSCQRKPVKRGIARRLFLYIIFIVLGTSGLIFLSNTLLLKPLYDYSLKKTMVDAVKTISRIDFTADADTWTAQLGTITTGQEFDVIIRNGSGMLYSSSVDFGLRPRPDKNIVTGPNGTDNTSQPEASGEDSTAQPSSSTDNQKSYFGRGMAGLESIGDDIYYGAISNRSGIELMICTKELDNGIVISVTQPIEQINESIRQSDILLAGCALIALVISAVFVSKISKRFTKPITQIQDTVGSIAALDFTRKCNVKTGDELQSLGEDVNKLSGELKNALDTLKLQNEKLEQDIIAQRQFISNASHELRTPLSIIKGYADEINTGYAKDAAQKKLYVEIIAEEATKMNRLLKEMLELTRMESGMAHMQNERKPVNDSIITFLEKYDGFIQQNSLNIKTELPEGLKDGYFDPTRFEQVLANYISNAAKYGDEKKIVKISSEEAGDSIRVSVFNTGRNIPDNIIDNIWDGFYKADAARTRVADSYGLGLSVVKAIQSSSGQQYGVKNVPKGVVFWFDVAVYKDTDNN